MKSNHPPRLARLVLATALVGLLAGCATQPRQASNASDWAHADESRDNYADSNACFRDGNTKKVAMADAIVEGVVAGAWVSFIGVPALTYSPQRQATPEETAANEAMLTNYRQCMHDKGYVEKASR